MTKISMIIRGGTLQGVYSTDENIEIELLDFDCDDLETSELNDKKMEELDFEYNNNKVFCIF